MRIAFHAPLKSPGHGTPSGDRRVARLLMRALRDAGHEVALATDFCSVDMAGDAQRQAGLRAQGERIARELVERWRTNPAAQRPELWFTYHVYYKAPDWVGPQVSTALSIPYVIAEASYAPKRAKGPWAQSHEAVRSAIERADLVLAPTRHDMVCLAPLVARERLVQLPPFLDAEPFDRARAARAAHRARLAAERRLDPAVPWIVVTAMMRPGDKLASYGELAQALAQLTDLRWQLVVVGDGPARAEVAGVLDRAAPGRIRYLGELGGEGLAQTCAAGDLFVWPAVNEAYGMAMLEAQAAGVPVVSSRLRGVPDVVCDGVTGLLAEAGNPAALADKARELLVDEGRRAQMGHAAATWVLRERCLSVAAARLDAVLRQALERAEAR